MGPVIFALISLGKYRQEGLFTIDIGMALGLFIRMYAEYG